MSKWLEQIFPRINTLWRGEWRKGFVEPARYLYDHELVLVSRGTAHLKIESREFDLKEGSFVIIPPAMLHTSKAQAGSVFRSCIHFDWQNSEQKVARPLCAFFPKKPKKSAIILPPKFIPRKIIHGKFDLKSSVPSLLETLFFQWEADNAFQRARARGTFWEILVQILWRSSKKHLRHDHSSQLAYAAKDLLDQNQSSIPSIQAALSSLGFSYAHICRLFHKNFGITPIEYLNAKRLESAKILLKNPKLSIAEVAYAAGFQDAGYFTRKFRQQNGITPKQYR